MGMKRIIVAGPVIVENGKLLLVRVRDDEFYKLPGGQVEPGETNEDACKREALEEINARITILKKLLTIYLDEHPKTKEKMEIELHHYLSNLDNPNNIKVIPPTTELSWLDIEEIKERRHNVAPNVRYLIERGDIK